MMKAEFLLCSGMQYKSNTLLFGMRIMQIYSEQKKYFVYVLHGVSVNKFVIGRPGGPLE